MARPLRIEFPGAFYHVTSRGIEKRSIYRSRFDRLKFLAYLESASERYGAVVHVYCLMNNHYHLLLETPRGNLSQIMRHINGAYTTYFNIKRDRVGHLFQGRYKAILVDSDAYALELSRYMHLNPVRADFVRGPADYKWSSFNAYTGSEVRPLWLGMKLIFAYFQGDLSKKRQVYKEYVEMSAWSGLSNPLHNTVASVVLGRNEFVERIKAEHLNQRLPDNDIPSLRRMMDKPTIRDITQAVQNIFGEDPKEAKRACLYFCHRYSGAFLRDIGEHFDMRDAAVSKASRRFAQRLFADTALQELAGKAKALLKVSNVQT